MPDHKPTDEQQAIIEAVANPQGASLMISAYAGTAKTTTLEMAAPGVKQQALALAFNKKIADELSGKMPPNFKVQTLNGLGHGAWMRTLPNSVKLDTSKLGKLVTATAKDRKVQLMSDQWDSVRQGVTAAMQAGLSPNNIGEPFVQDTPEVWADILEDVHSDEFDLVHFMCREVLTESINMGRAGIITFDDQVYLPTILGGKWFQYPRVFVDESQDLSPLNHRMLEKCAIGPITVVGDPRQAIYKFRGADSESMTTMRRLRTRWDDKSLTLTFRCPKAIVARQQEHAPGYTAFATNPDGFFAVPPIDPETYEGLWKWSFIEQHMVDIQAPGCAILCRNNAPLLSMAFKLIASGIGCHMLGRDIGKGLERLVKKLSKDDTSMPIVKFMGILHEWLDREIAISTANDKPERADKIQDQADCIQATIDGSNPSNVGDLLSTIDRMFSRDRGLVTLSTIHRAKGLEWPLVVHLDPWRIPSKQALMAYERGDPSHLIQENNLRYVAETRTRHTLIEADSRSFRT